VPFGSQDSGSQGPSRRLLAGLAWLQELDLSRDALSRASPGCAVLGRGWRRGKRTRWGRAGASASNRRYVLRLRNETLAYGHLEHRMGTQHRYVQLRDCYGCAGRPTAVCRARAPRFIPAGINGAGRRDAAAGCGLRAAWNLSGWLATAPAAGDVIDDFRVMMETCPCRTRLLFSGDVLSPLVFGRRLPMSTVG
jgi:hypothetical protein